MFLFIYTEQKTIYMGVKKGYKSKAGLHHTINVEVAQAFDELAKEKCINKSLLVEKLIQKWIEENK